MTIALVVAFLIAALATFLILGPESNDEVAVQSSLQRREFISSKHKWEDSQIKGFYFCCLCNKLMAGFWSKILECKKCGIVVHQYCKLTKLKKPDCKYIIRGSGGRPTQPVHQWRKSIHSINSICNYCESVCSGFEALMCLWCHRMKHVNCKDEDQCDLGSLHNLILSPNEISYEGGYPRNIFRSLKQKKKELKEKTSDDSENQHTDEIRFNIVDRNKSPVVVLVNKKSGGQTGNEYLKSFYLLLNPLQVISVLDEGLDRLKIFKDLKNLRIVVGGGDGTVCSVLNYVTSGAVEEWVTNNPPIAVFPLGTGNDLSRALGWGPGGQDRDPKLYLEELEKKGTQIAIDRWIMTISNPQHDEGEKVYTIYNYLGVGLDARVCYDFHKVREKYPALFVSPLSNKLIYTQMGALDLFVKKGQVLIKDYIVVEVDGKQISLEGLENIVLLNITHWAGGVSGLWKESAEFKPNRMDDGMIEILGVSDMLHLGQIQIGMDLPFQISQGREVVIKSIADCDMNFQIDGEPFQLKSPFLVKVALKDKVNLLATSNPTPQEKMRRIIDEALEKAVIDRGQHRYFLDKLNN